MSDLLRCLAFAFRRKGTLVMPANDLRMLLAFNLNWFAPADAKRFVDRVLEGGFVVEENGSLRIKFDPASIDVPLNFKPVAASILEEPFPAMPTAVPPPASAAAPAAASVAPPSAPSGPAPDTPAALAAAPVHPVADAHEVIPPSVAPSSADATARPGEPPVVDPADAERARRGGLLDLRVAKLVVARRKGEDIKERLVEVERAILGK